MSSVRAELLRRYALVVEMCARKAVAPEQCVRVKGGIPTSMPYFDGPSRRAHFW